jgi:hypothetical protein
MAVPLKEKGRVRGLGGDFTVSVGAAGDSILASRAGGGVKWAECVTIVSGDNVNCCRHFGQFARVVPGGMTPGAIFLLKPQWGQVTTTSASIIPSLGLILIGIIP